MKINLNIYYSAACNLSCTYCCMNNTKQNFTNTELRRSILNNQFQSWIISHFNNSESDTEIVTLGIWGMEPSVNQDLWMQFIIPILDTFPSIKGIFIPTNGLNFNYEKWAIPLLNYCNTNHRKIKLWLQFSVDGPESSMIANSLLHCVQSYTTNEYFRLKISTKSTFDKQKLYQDIESWYSYMGALKDLCKNMAQPNCDISLVGMPPTFERPGKWEQKDGQQWANWHVPILVEKEYCCSAGINSYTVTCKNEIYHCQLLLNYDDFEKEDLLSFERFLIVYNELLNQHLINEHNITKLYNAISSIYCWGVGRGQGNEDDLPYYILMLGNGALQEGTE